MVFLLATGILFVGLFVTKFYSNVEIILPNKIFFFGLILFYGINILSALWSLNAADAIFESQKIIIFLCALVLFTNIFNTEEHINSMLKSVVLLSLIVLGISYFELENFTANNVAIESGYFSMAGHKNILSSLIYLLLPFAILSYITFKNYWKILGGISVLLILLLIVILNTRSVQLSLVVGTVSFLVFFLSSKLNRVLKKATISIFFVLGAIAIVVILISASNSNNQAATIKTASLHERYQLWSNTFKLIEENPMVGVGAGNWQYNYTKFSVKNIESSSYYSTTFRRPHNDFLQVFAETGLVGFFLFVFLIAYIGFAAVKNLQQETNTTVLIIFCSLIGFVVDAFFSFPKERVTHILIVALLLAILLPLVSIKTKYSRQKASLFFYFMLPILAFTVYVGCKRVSGEYYTLKSIEAQELNDTRGAINNGYKAKSFLYSTDPNGMPVDSYIGWGYAAEGKLDSLLLVSKSAFELCPFDYKVLTNYGYVLIRLGQNHSAELILKESLRINPNFEATLLNLSVLEYNRANYLSAQYWLSAIADYKIKYPTNFERIEEKLKE